MLGDVHDVGRHAKGLGTGVSASPAKTGDHFVKNQQDVVGRADVTQALQVTLGRNHDTGGTRERLDNDGRDVAGVVQRDEFEQIVGQFRALVGHAA